MKNNLKTTSFWVGVSGAIVVILDCLSSILNIKLYSQEVQTIIISICSVLIMVGYITEKSVDDKVESTKEDLLQDLEDDK
jgi:uncharacterized membrane protein